MIRRMFNLQNFLISVSLLMIIGVIVQVDF